MKKKKTGSVAIPFLITFLISLVIIGGAAMYIYDKIDNDESSLVSMVNEVGTLSDEDNHTILFALDMSDTVTTDSDDYIDEEDDEEYYEEDGYSDEEEYEWEEDSEEEEEKETYSQQPYTFMIMRSEPVNKQILFMGIPSNMLVGESNKQAQDIYVDNGTATLTSSLEYTLGIKIDRHMTLNTESFKKICNVLGGVTYAVPKDVKTIAQADGEQYLSAEQAAEIISCANYSGGELQRISTASSLITAMVNQTSGERIAGNLDNIFNTIINMTESDISAIDYNNRKYAIKFMLKYSDPVDSESRSTRAQFITPYGKEDGKEFIADKYFADDIKVYFDEASAEEQIQTEENKSEQSEEQQEKETENE
ncbi:MAG: LCP family protein [Oscillospiraceae bacterium]|nr:LCP family protein [Oscillospiraceae bacterium]